MTQEYFGEVFNIPVFLFPCYLYSCYRTTKDEILETRTQNGSGQCHPKVPCRSYSDTLICSLVPSYDVVKGLT
jgi:hypothetical protein